MDIKNQTKRAKQSIFCLNMMENINDHVMGNLRESRRSFAEAGYDFNRNSGLAPSQIQADIKHLRRELLVLSKMFGDA